MKKLILGLAVTASSLAFAQQAKSSSSPVSFGVKAGMNVSSLSKDEGLDDQKSKIGFNAGVFANIPVASSFSIQPEVLYSQYGSKAVYNNVVDANNSVKRSYTTDLGYITVPVMFQYNFVPNFYLEAGPEFGFNVTAKEKYDQTTVIGGNTTTTSGTEDINKDNMNTFNFGIGIGAGYYFTDNIGLTARYVAGVTDVAKDRPSGSDAIRNNVFQVGLAFKF
ncbi:porin family protein [Chryseobacterium gwangjuense]|jgi:outer membrane immunogenic protein|uniref:porin family protein n=1 Tax=Chryseobacterium gwangjuense TaxID=1069980 RepID=UPI001E480337|nr:porin family protein [Chryseobacterium gwangjuense]MCE3074446.1 PorT family protein [Chryseobacterium gwangjuense]